MIYGVVMQVEMSSYRCISVIDDGVSVSVHSLSECLFSLSYVLFVAFFACDEIYEFVGVAGHRMCNLKFLVVCAGLKCFRDRCVLTSFASVRTTWCESFYVGCLSARVVVSFGSY